MRALGSPARVVVTTGVGLLLLAGCAQEVARGDVEDSIREAMADQGVELTAVTCPGGVQAEVGASIVCEVELVGVDPLGVPVDRIKVVVTDVEGSEVRYRLEPLAVGADDQGSVTG